MMTNLYNECVKPLLLCNCYCTQHADWLNFLTKLAAPKSNVCTFRCGTHWLKMLQSDSGCIDWAILNKYQVYCKFNNTDENA